MQAAQYPKQEVAYTLPSQHCGCRRKNKRELGITVPKEVYVKRRQERQRPKHGTKEGINQYATPDPPLEKIVDHLVQKVRGEDEGRIALVQDVLDFVTSNVKYQLNSEGYRVRYPIETLADQRGHCLDSCLLAATLLSLAGVDAGILHIFEKVPGHAMLGINLVPGEYLPVHVAHNRYAWEGKANQAFENYVDERRKKKTNSYPRTFTVQLGEQRSVKYTIDDPRILDGFPAIWYKGRTYVIIEMTTKDWRIPRYAFINGSRFDILDRPAMTTGFNRSRVLPTVYHP